MVFLSEKLIERHITNKGSMLANFLFDASASFSILSQVNIPMQRHTCVLSSFPSPPCQKHYYKDKRCNLGEQQLTLNIPKNILSLGIVTIHTQTKHAQLTL